MAYIKLRNLCLLLVTFATNWYQNSANLLNPLSDLAQLGNFVTSNYHFPSLKDELSKFSLEEVEHQLKIGNLNEDKNLNAIQLMEKYGYEAEVHIVTTEDGYKPSLYRIPGKGKPVLLVHGLLSNAASWLTVGPQAALPYQLADAGYDVWLADARGATADSSGHVRLSADDDVAQYWDFSWDEIGRYDVPAMIDYILHLTKHSKLKYVGHSQGTTSFFVMCSERPEYNDKIELMVALSPVVWMSHLVSPLVRLVSPLAGPLSPILLKVLGLYKVTPDNPLVEILTKVICGETALANLICGNIMFAVSGFDYAQMNVTNMPVIFSHTPGGSATKQLFHYAQGIVSGKFRRYDHGPIKNLAVYGTSEPPDYPVENVSAPVALFYRRNSDWISSHIDVEILRKKIKNVVDYHEIPFEKFCHTDYIWAKDVKKLVYNRVLKLFKKFKIDRKHQRN